MLAVNVKVPPLETVMLSLPLRLPPATVRSESVKALPLLRLKVPNELRARLVPRLVIWLPVKLTVPTPVWIRVAVPML